MDSDKSKQICNEIGSALSEILPALYQLLQDYQVSCPITIKQCVSCNGKLVCWPQQPQDPRCPPTTPLDDPSEPELDSEKMQQFYTSIASEMSHLSQVVQQTDESFEIHVLIDPATASNSYTTCKFVDGILLCAPATISS
jgi:hypothetical protein